MDEPAVGCSVSRLLILDVDGTLVDTRAIRRRMAQGEPLQAAMEALAAPPIAPVVQWAQEAQAAGAFLAVFTARRETDAGHTADLLDALQLQPGAVYHRGVRDDRVDTRVKRDMLARLQGEHPWTGQALRYALALDDNPYVVDMWQECRVPVIQVPGWDFYHSGPVEPALPEVHQWITAPSVRR